MYKLVFDSETTNNLYYSIDDFMDEKINVKKLSISKKQLLHLYNILDIESNYNTLDHLYKKFNNNIDKTIKITKDKLKNAIFLLLAYGENIIHF